MQNLNLEISRQNIFVKNLQGEFEKAIIMFFQSKIARFFS